MNTNLIAIIALTNWLTTNWVTVGTVNGGCNVEGCLVLHEPKHLQKGTIVTNEAVLLSYRQDEHLILLDQRYEHESTHYREVPWGHTLPNIMILTNGPITNYLWNMTNYWTLGVTNR